MTKQDDKQETATLVPVDRHALAGFNGEWTLKLSEFADVPCTSPDEEAWWVEWRNHVHTELTRLDAERKEVTGPLDREKKLIDGWYKADRAPAERFKELANKKLGAYALAQDAAATAAQQAATAALASGDNDAVVDALAAIPDIQKAAGNSTRLEWVWEVENIDQVPAMYTRKVIDDAAVQAYVDRMGDGHYPMMPGIRFTKVAKVRPTGRRK